MENSFGVRRVPVHHGTLAHEKVLVFVVHLAAHTTNITEPASISAHTHPGPSSS
jgi:hypothetical protein